MTRDPLEEKRIVVAAVGIHAEEGEAESVQQVMSQASEVSIERGASKIILDTPSRP